MGALDITRRSDEVEVSVAGEVLFAVDEDQAVLGEPATLADAGLRERAHLQEWLIAHPTILGDDVVIVTSEFGR